MVGRYRRLKWPTRSSRTRGWRPSTTRFEDDRSDVAVYVAIAAELGARRVLDVGCGTGAFALLLARRGIEVIGVDPARASLDVARVKPDADRVHWLHADATALPALRSDLATMTGNVAQAIAEPTHRGWEEWTPAASRRVVHW